MEANSFAMTAGRTVISTSQTWCTPPKYVRAVKQVFGGRIHLDPCSNHYSVVGAEVSYALPEKDGLESDWNFPTIYVNPPYGADRHRGTTIKDWLRRCAESHHTHGSSVLALIPVAPNTRHWKDYIWGVASGICFLYDTRLRFLEDGKDTGKGAPMACCMVYWGIEYGEFQNVFSQYGATVDLRPQKGLELGPQDLRAQTTLF